MSKAKEEFEKANRAFSECCWVKPYDRIRILAPRQIEKCILQVEKWVKDGEDVSLHRVKEWLIEKYQLL